MFSVAEASDDVVRAEARLTAPRDGVTDGSGTGAVVRAWRVTVAVARFTRRHVPKRLLPVFAVCLVIPGPLDEMALLAVVAVVVLRDAAKRAEFAAVVREAWRS